MQDPPTPEMDADFEKADIILADALERFQSEGVNAYVYGSALLEIGIAALVKVGETETSIAEQARDIARRLGTMMGPSA